MTKAIHSKAIRKQEAEQARKEAALKSTKFSRYLLIRYTLAGFFFANLYWLLGICFHWNWYGLLPIGLLALSILAIAEQVRMYGTDQVYLAWTKRFFQVQLFLLVILLALCHLPKQLTLLYPVFSDSPATKIFLSLVWLLGIGLALLNLRRIALIADNKDKAYQRIKQLEKFV